MSGAVVKKYSKVVVADFLVIAGFSSLVYAYLAIPAGARALSFIDQAFIMCGFVAMLIHYFWMLIAVGKYTLGGRRVFWFLTIALTYILGSYLFYFRVYRPMEKALSKGSAF